MISCFNLHYIGIFAFITGLALSWYDYVTAWKVSKYEPEITPYLDTFQAVYETFSPFMANLFMLI